MLDTDASNHAIGAVLSQYQPGETIEDARVIAYGSRTLSNSERNYDTRRKELLAIIYFLNNFRYYLEAKEFHLRTDHQALKSLLSKKSPLSSQEARWAQLVWCFPIAGITYREGKKHANADALSRHPEYTNAPVIDEKTTDEEYIREYADVIDFQVNCISTQLEDMPWNVDDIPDLQRRDSILGYVRLAKQGDENAVTNCGPYRRLLDKIILAEDILFLDATTEHPRRVLITKAMSQKLLPLLHDNILSGHLGFKRTLKRARERVFRS